MSLPLSWQLIGGSLLLTLLVAAVFLAVGEYARVETIPGALSPDAGIAVIVPPRPGVVQRVSVREGEKVAAGRSLIMLDSEELLTDGSRASQRMRQALSSQDRQLSEQGGALLAAAAAERSQLREQMLGLKSAIKEIDDQIVDQRRLVDVSEAEFRDVALLADKGFVSRRDLASREATLLQRRQQLSQLRQSRTERQASLAAAERSVVQSLANGQAQFAGTGSTRSALAQQLAQIDRAEGFTISAPVTGVATAVTVRAGQAVTAQQALMMIVPESSRLRAELSVPTTAAGFLVRGQEVRLAVDAFPFQRFGTIPARIAEIATAATVQRGTDGRQVPTYLVLLDIPRPWVEAFGRKQRLLPGMTLTARIVTRRQSLLQWLFEPLYAVRAR